MEVFTVLPINTTLSYIPSNVRLEKESISDKNKEFKNSFTSNYNCDKLVYFENFIRIEEAIAREKQIKGGSRKVKEELINAANSGWKDLWEERFSIGNVVIARMNDEAISCTITSQASTQWDCFVPRNDEPEELLQIVITMNK